MSNFYESLSPYLQSQVRKVRAMTTRGSIFLERWTRGAIDEDCNAVPRNPQLVAATKARIAATRKVAFIGFPSETCTRSRLGGLPNLPPSMSWPLYEEEPMTFLAQLDLSELPRCDELAWLPASGILLYFAGRRWGEWVEEASRILYAQDASSELRSAPSDTPVAKPTNIIFEIRDTYAPFTGEDDTGQFEDNGEIETWRHALKPVNCFWQIGGWPDVLQSRDMPYCAECRYRQVNFIDKGQREDSFDLSLAGWALLGQFDLERLFTRPDGYSRGFFWVKTDEAQQGSFERAVLLGQTD